MDKFWSNEPSMEKECKTIMQSICGSGDNNSNSWSKLESSTVSKGGRIWLSCVSCARVVMLEGLGRFAKKKETISEEKNGFLLTVCGSCERRNGRMLEGGQDKAIRIRWEMIADSAACRSIASYCKSKGWKDMEYISDRVMDMRTLIWAQLAGMTAKSVTLEDLELKMLDYVDLAFL